MAIKGAKSIPEYAIRKYLQNKDFDMSYFELTMYGNQAELEDTCGNTITLVYDAESRTVYEL